MIRKIALAALAALLLLTISCNKEANEASETTVDVIEQNDVELTEKIDVSVCFLGSSVSDYIGNAIYGFCKSVVATPEEAKAIVVKSSELEGNRNAIVAAYNAGKSIVEIEPTVATHSSFWNSIGAPVYLEGDESGNDLILLAVCGNSCYQLQNPYRSDVYVTQVVDSIDVCSESGSADIADNVNYTSYPVEYGKTSEYFSTLLNSLARWLDETKDGSLHSRNSTVPEFEPELSKLISDASMCQHIVKTFEVGAEDFQICKVLWSSPDKVTRHSTIDLSIYIAPLYSYELNDNGNSGDYYFVSMSLVSHNKPLYDVYKNKHGGVKTYAHVFYSKNLKWTATMVKRTNPGKWPPLVKTLGNDISFFETPKPESTASSQTYTTGFSSSLNVSGQGGILGGKPTGTLTVGGTFTWNKSNTEIVQDQSIEMSTDPSNRAVSYNFITNNDHEEDDTQKAVPAIARTDQKCEASWCWHINGTKDDDTTSCFHLKFKLEPIYGYMYRHLTWAAEGHTKTTNLLDSGDEATLFKVCIPNRTRTGILQVTSTNSEYMCGFTIYDKSGKIVAKDDGAYEKNSVQKYQVPVGIYDVRFEIRNGTSGESLGKYEISDVEVRTAKTSEKSTMDGHRIDQ